MSNRSQRLRTAGMARRRPAPSLRFRPCAEVLEDRTVPSASLVRDINPLDANVYPTGLVNVNGVLFFAGDDPRYGYELRAVAPGSADALLVRDICPGERGSVLGVGPNVNGVLFFVADDGVHGYELWKSDGTAAGTVLVKDLRPGSAGSDLFYLTNVNGKLFFGAEDGFGGSTLWVSDGTEAGTVPLRDLRIRRSGLFRESDSRAAVGDTLFFQADDGIAGMELWKSDGTPGGTVLVQDIQPGAAGSQPASFVNVNGVAYFTAVDPVAGWEVWRSDGTAPGTALLRDLTPGPTGTIVTELANLAGTLMFTATVAGTGEELWKSDGTALGTVLVRDIVPGPFGSFPSELLVVDGQLFFAAQDAEHGFEPWRSDGTAAGTYLVRDIHPGGQDSYLEREHSFDWAAVGEQVYLFANDGRQHLGLWRSDGTAGGTVLVEDFGRGISRGFRPEGLTGVGDTLYYAFWDWYIGFGYVLWRSDGTALGTGPVSVSSPGPASSLPYQLTPVGGSVYLVAYDGTRGWELWKSDGTTAGTTLVRDLIPGYGSSDPYGLTNVSGTLYFSANAGGSGGLLWKTDGTEVGTVPVAPGTGLLGAGFLTNVNGTLFFAGTDGTLSGTELWKSDGSAAGTVRIKDIFPGSMGSNPRELVNVNGTLFFVADDGVRGAELWKSDGTEAGTVPVRDIRPGSGSAFPTFFGRPIPDRAVIDRTLYFIADDGTTGLELWKSDGTEAGTVLVRDLRPGSAGGAVAWLTAAGGVLFFRANDGVRGAELWKSDGTAGGTVVVRDVNPGSADASPTWLVEVNGQVFFAATDSRSGGELWRSDGTEAGTVPVRDIRPGEGGSIALASIGALVPPTWANVAGVLYFRADDGVHGLELWRSDGTESGTALVEDLTPGSRGSEPWEMINGNGRLFFHATTSSYGTELWKVNQPPRLDPLPDRTIPSSVDVLTVPLTATDPDGDPLTFEAVALSLAYVLDYELALEFAGDYYEGTLGLGERWLFSAATGLWHYVTPDGVLWRWEDSGPAFVDWVGASYHADMSLLWDAQPDRPGAAVSVSGGTLTIDRDDGFAGSFVVWVLVSDGVESEVRRFTVLVLV